MSDEEKPDKPKHRRVHPRDSKGNRIPATKLVKAAREMLAQGMTDGDIKRQMAEKFGMKPRSFERHISLARQRNREQVNRSAEECKGHSLSYWTGKLQSAERTISQATGRMQDAHRRLDEANAVIDDDSTLEERKESARVTVGNCTEQIETYRKQVYTAQRDAFLCQQQVDRLLGNHAPTKVSQTTADGRDVALPAPDRACEPSNMESAAHFVGQFMDMLEPMGLYIVDSLGRRMHPDGSFEATTIVQSPPAPSTVELLPRTSEPRPQCIEATEQENSCG